MGEVWREGGELGDRLVWDVFDEGKFEWLLTLWAFGESALAIILKTSMCALVNNTEITTSKSSLDGDTARSAPRCCGIRHGVHSSTLETCPRRSNSL